MITISITRLPDLDFNKSVYKAVWFCSAGSETIKQGTDVKKVNSNIINIVKLKVIISHTRVSLITFRGTELIAKNMSGW